MGKRMFSTSIIESDAFLDMPLSAQSLYIHLNMNADNDGFVQPKKILRMVGAAHDDLVILIQKKFLLTFDTSSVVVIKHWWINNTKRTDRYAPTTYTTEWSELGIKNNNSYTKNTTQLHLEISDGNQPARTRQELGASTQHNTTQHNTTQPSSSQMDSSGLSKQQKRSYAIAMEKEREQEDRAKKAKSRDPSNPSPFSEIRNKITGIKPS